MIVKANVGTMGNRTSVMVDTETATPKTVFEQAHIDFSTGSQVSLNGITLRAGEMGMTLAALNVTEECYLSSIVKADSAVA